MKKHLLIPTLATLFALPAFPGADMDNTNIEGHTHSSNMQPPNNDKNHKKDDNRGVDDKAISKSKNMPIQVKDAQETNSNMKIDKNKQSHHKKSKHNQQTLANDNQNDADENENLRNIAEPEINNINNNLRIPDGETSRLNREMMLDGPQGGFQNNQPRGIGSR